MSNQMIRPCLRSIQWRTHVLNPNRFHPKPRLPDRFLHASRSLRAIQPFILADIGEGIREVEIIQWFVQPGASVEEWDKLCEVQSDKASVEITSRFAGVVKKLHYDAGEVAAVGKPLVDIDVPSEGGQWDVERDNQTRGTESVVSAVVSHEEPSPPLDGKKLNKVDEIPERKETIISQACQGSKMLATPAVRHLIKEHNLRVDEVRGTGRDGRVLKEDIMRFVKDRASEAEAPARALDTDIPQPVRMPRSSNQQETLVQLTHTQSQMFKTMTRSLSIPHFTYADEVDFTMLSTLRSRLNLEMVQTPIDGTTHLTYLPFIVKAVSLALKRYPILNARVDIDPAASKPALVMRSHHNIGIAMDTPQGLLVPVLKDVSALSVLDIAREILRLQGLGATSKLTPADLSGGTITVSNVGVIGGTYTAPVIVDREVAILGVGKIRTVPGFGPAGDLVRKSVVGFSWCADHRVVDGATMARAGEIVRLLLEAPERMVLTLR